MKSMRVMRFNDRPNAPALIPDTAPVPEPGAPEMLVQVHAAGVTPTELRWYPTTHTRSGDQRIGAIPGHEFSGRVVEVGAGVDPAWIGREVFGMNDWFSGGASAEFCLAVESAVAAKPHHLSHAEAAAVPIGALTAWQGLFNRAKLRSGERVLIHGGAGAVGVFAIQLASMSGAHVITTASKRNFEFLLKLGCHEVIDYHGDRFDEKVRDLDVVFDAVGGETLRRSWGLLKPHGRMVTIAAGSDGTEDERIGKAFFIVEPNHKELTEIALLLETGPLQCFVDAILPLEKASEAYCGKVAGRRGQGKVILSILDPD